MKTIKLKKGKNTTVDDCEYTEMARYKWHITAGYAARSTTKNGKKSGEIYMHRQIMSCPSGLCVDHISGDKLDNQRKNLRICKHWQNLVNRGASKNNKLGVKGVYYQEKGDGYSVRIGNKYIAFRKKFEDAVNVYNKKAVQKYGEFARLN